MPPYHLDDPVDRARDALLSNVSHELRTPLTSIIAATEILRNFTGEDPAVQHEFLEMIDKEAHRLLDSVGSLLRLAELERDPTTLHFENIDAAVVVKDAVRASADHLTSAGLPPTVIHDSEHAVFVRADRARLLEILARLLDNAAKFATETQGRNDVSPVEIRIETRDDNAQILVMDEGPGIPSSRRVGLFRRFSNTLDLDSILTDKPKGVGAGLPICSRLAEAHGGTLSYADREYRGSCFTLTIPLARQETPGADPANAPTQSVSS